ncbi:transposase [Kitasatospora sp. NPDC059160]|uniref:transposase n=1 Tax=Kitasatospora sp. NPDC059160 TaxID=3346748 RepID=UPI0036ADF6D7
MQHMLNRAEWDADAVRDDLREYVVENLHDDRAVLVADETGDMKKGKPHRRRPTAVHRHRRPDRELPGRRLPGYASRRGHAAVDREFYIPHSALVDRSARPVPGGRARPEDRVRHQARSRASHHCRQTARYA